MRHEARPGPPPVGARDLALVAVGGAVGVLARAGLGGALASGVDGGWPWGTWTANVTGSFLLGLLLAGLSRTSPGSGDRRGLRLLVGTGLLGGYTTYSALALDTVTLAADGAVGRAGLYAGSTVLLGVAAAAAGLLAGARLRGPRAGASGPDR